MDIELLRPAWLLLIFPLTLLLILFWRNMKTPRSWAAVVDPLLLPHLLSGKSSRRRRWPILLWFLASILVLVILSGPVWEKLPLPVFNQQSALIIALDLSASMNANDIKPSRLARAKLKLKDLLNNRNEGQTALIAYAGTSYTVSPLTDDTDTINALVASLGTDIMPSQGSRADIAINHSLNLFTNSGISEGDILLMTDGIAKTVQEQIRKLDLGRFRLSILSVGTREGAPIPLQGGGFIKDQEGSIVIARTDSSSLSSLARQRGGIHRTLTINDKDLNDLQQLWLMDFLSAKHQQTEFKSDRWQEQGPWLLLLLTPLAAWVFRRGILLPVMVVILFLPIHNEGYASDTIWDRLWHNNNQRALQAFESGDHQQAAQLFEAPDWKASALYEAGDYAQALEQWQQTDSDESWYNRGNSLARLGRYQEALTSYDQALKINAEHEDALFNRKLIEQALTQQREQQPKNPNQQQDSKDSQDRHKQDERQESSSNNSAGQNSQQDQAESKNKSDANSTQDNANSQPNAESNSSGERDIQDKQPTPTQEPSTAMDSIQNNDDPEQSEASQQQPNQQAEHKDQQGDALDLNERQDHSMSEQVEAQWLRRIPDDPGGLLRNKFRYLYSQQPNSRQEAEPW